MRWLLSATTVWCGYHSSISLRKLGSWLRIPEGGGFALALPLALPPSAALLLAALAAVAAGAAPKPLPFPFRLLLVALLVVLLLAVPSPEAAALSSAARMSASTNSSAAPPSMLPCMLRRAAYVLAASSNRPCGGEEGRAGCWVVRAQAVVRVAKVPSGVALTTWHLFRVESLYHASQGKVHTATQILPPPR